METTDQQLLDRPTDKHPELAEWRKQDVAIAAMNEEYGALTVENSQDTEGCKRVHDARMIVKKTRIEIEKKRKELKADALAYGKEVDGEAKRLTGLLTPIERHLQGQEDIVAKERERIKELARQVKIQVTAERLKAFQECGVARMESDVSELSEAQFEFEIEACRNEVDERKLREAERVAAEAKERDRLAAEANRQRLVAEEQQRVADSQAAVQAKLDAERQRAADEQAAAQVKLDADRAEIERVKQSELDRIEKVKQDEIDRLAAIEAEKQEQARIAEEAEAKRLADIEAEKRRAEDIEQARLQAIEDEKQRIEAAERLRLEEDAKRPYREKLMKLAVAVSEMPNPPGGYHGNVEAVLQTASADIEEIANR